MPYLTAAYPGIGGQLKTVPEDFLVEEIPLYTPSGQGQHVYVTIEKRDVTTFGAIKAIARALDIPAQAIGHAGLKDAYAVTRQTLSIDKVSPEAVQALELPKIKILDVCPHRNKLKVGHLAGNRFEIRVRQVTPEVMPTVGKVLEVLSAKGVPNFFGAQRFGNRANTHRLGEMLIRKNVAEFVTELLGRPQPTEAEPVQQARALIDDGRWAEALAAWPSYLSEERRVLKAIVQDDGRPEIAFKVLNRKLGGLFISAYQSHLFNELLTQRLDSLDQLEVGDVAYLHRNGAAFLVEDAILEQPRANSFEISPAGPIFGPKLLAATGKPGEQEHDILAKEGLTLDDFRNPYVKAHGVRRPYRFELKQATVWWDEGLMLSFELPPGAYATTVLAEIMKPDEF